MIICDYCGKEILEDQPYVNLVTENSENPLSVPRLFFHRDCIDSFIKMLPKARRVKDIEAEKKRWIDDIDYWRDIMWDIGLTGSEWHKGAASAFNTALGIVKDGHVMRPAPPEYRKLRKYGEH